MDYLFGVTLMGSLMCLFFIEYSVYRIREAERIKARMAELRSYSPSMRKGNS